MSTSTSAQPTRIPNYCRQKFKGRSPLAYVDLPTGNEAKPIKRVYLGVHKTADSRAKYETTIGQWLARGRTWPLEEREAGLPPTDRRSVAFIVADFLTWAENHYKRKDGSMSSQFQETKDAVKPLCALFAHQPAGEFTPVNLETIQMGMVKGGRLCRKTIKERISIIKRVFRRAAARGLIPAGVSGALECADALPQSHPDVKESRVIKPVPQHLIDGVRPLVSRQVRALIDLQLMTAARPSELLSLNMIDVNSFDSSDPELWIHRPRHHKTAHKGKSREIWFHSAAQKVLAEFMTHSRPVDTSLFSPCEAERERRTVQHEKRLEDGTPINEGNRPGTNCTTDPQWRPGDAYTYTTYSNAIERACLKAFPPPAELARVKVDGKRGHKRWESDAEWRQRLGKEKWEQLQAWIKSHHWFPYQLRHNAATMIAEHAGFDTSRIVLGHSLPGVTAIYVDDNIKRAKDRVKAMSKFW